MDEYCSNILQLEKEVLYFTSSTSQTYIDMWVDDVGSAYWTANLSRRKQGTKLSEGKKKTEPNVKNVH